MPRRNKNARKGNTKNHKASVSSPNLESVASNESFSEKEPTPVDTPCCVHIHSKRKRLVDADGVSAKAAIDGLVHAGILPDDSPEYVEKVTYSQEKSKEEETIIYVYKEL